MLTEVGTVSFLGIDFANMSYAEVASEVGRLSRQSSFSYIVTPNVDHIVQLHEGQDEAVVSAFRAAYLGAHRRLCDSRVVQLLARWRGVHLDVVTGSDLTGYLFNEGHLDGRKVALIGGDDSIRQELLDRYPAVLVVQHQPPMGVLREPAACAQIVDFIESGAFDVVLFAIGAPQSEIIAHQCLLADRSRGVALCIGASIEFLLGRKARAPRWMQRAKLEWAFRLMSEPRRLWRRYLLIGPRIFRLALASSDQ
jgi:N-acetylglucosaminyldiphosphoundecaprenol N-acetyl-beta-D-mannosaminyltransferase